MMSDKCRIQMFTEEKESEKYLPWDMEINEIRNGRDDIFYNYCYIFCHLYE